ncbi:Cof-type HAD-IIB family hydrolase [Pseudobacteroides cellulosolvens]|uniref:Cof-like hydrolase n=1 Tax=Pseudobacteroides cellulosolvens ATCC 35603 = DSM 2933 TaxID=398512 RepID=A0A0L6JLN6_9FIRM|nr:Cof-type HAD-IIB family hydrolase [Pseudobacteroides cellulosolvens]KNY26684.1 Cof-like hydrolase [Pseudobacteroides cellulosolvens ATCC 35603 = DSM 2933]
MKLYISDMDGTLLNGDKEISCFSKDIINVLISKGGYFSIASARTAATALKILEEVKLNVPIALMNGVVIYDTSTNEYEKVEALCDNTTKKIVNILRACKIEGFMYTISENRLNTYYEKLTSKVLQEFVDERIKKYNKTFEKVESLLDKINGRNKIIYFTLLDEYEPLLKVHDLLKDLPDIELSLYKDVYSEKTYLLEIYSSNASKHNAVEYLRQKYNFNEVIGFGDNYNDIPMLKACNQFYAVDNAVGELKELATGVIEDNNSNGVAKFIASRENI